jgi:hypothetical protein
MARRRPPTQNQQSSRRVVVHIALTEAERNALKAALSLEGTTMQAYFAAKATEKIAQLPALRGRSREGRRAQTVVSRETLLDPSALMASRAAETPVPSEPPRHARRSSPAARLAQLDTLLAQRQTAGQCPCWVRVAAEVVPIEPSTLRERLAQARAQHQLLCVRCLHVWQPLIADPAICPHCQQDWSKPYTRRPYGLRLPSQP